MDIKSCSIGINVNTCVIYREVIFLEILKSYDTTESNVHFVDDINLKILQSWSLSNLKIILNQC